MTRQATARWRGLHRRFAVRLVASMLLVTIWAAFLVLAPVMAYLMWWRFRRTVAEF